MLRLDLERGRTIYQGVLGLSQAVLSDGARKVHFRLAQAQPDGFRAIRNAPSMILPLAVDEGTNGIPESQIGLGVECFLTLGQGRFRVAAAHPRQFGEADTLFGTRQ